MLLEYGGPGFFFTPGGACIGKVQGEPCSNCRGPMCPKIYNPKIYESCSYYRHLTPEYKGKVVLTCGAGLAPLHCPPLEDKTCNDICRQYFAPQCKKRQCPKRKDGCCPECVDIVVEEPYCPKSVCPQVKCKEPTTPCTDDKCPYQWNPDTYSWKCCPTCYIPI